MLDLLFYFANTSYLPMSLVNFKMSEADFIESTQRSCFANFTTMH